MFLYLLLFIVFDFHLHINSFLLTSEHISFSFISGVSGTSLFNSVSLMAYNVFYTSVPVLVSVLDKDLSEGTVIQHPQILFYCQAGRFAVFPPFIVCIFYITGLGYGTGSFVVLF